MQTAEASGGSVAANRVDSDVPEVLFQHVEHSIDNGIKVDMLLEVAYKKDPITYWIAKVTMVCGPVVRLRFIGSDKDFWYDLSKDLAHSLGWCASSGEPITPPKDISDQHPENSVVPLLKSAIDNCVPAPKDVIEAKGYPPIERILAGMRVEVQDEKHPFRYWIATIIRNVGGRLLLRYDAPQTVVNDFWLFYTNPRIRRVGFANKKGDPWELHYPTSKQYASFDIPDWEDCVNNSFEENNKNPFPVSILPEEKILQPHHFDCGMKLEAVNPANMSDICPATIVEIFDDFRFLVMMDIKNANGLKEFWLCNTSHPYIFPVGWAQHHNINICPPSKWRSNGNFIWKKYLEQTNAISAPSVCFEHKENMTNSEFKVGMKLEAVNPLDSFSIVPAKIVRIVNHLLQVKIESTGNLHWYSFDSTDIFPSRWCDINDAIMPETKQDRIENDVCKKLADFKPHIACQINTINCDRIFFNYKCYSGPHISKNKLSQLPKHVGPGPISLVIREVLNMIISVAYKPGRLLKDWEYDGTPPPDVKVELLKAKLKTNTHHAYVQVVNDVEEVEAFCKEMCSKLQACPYLFGPVEIVDQCPERCSAVNKSKFRKKRRKRGLHFMTIRARERRAAACEASEMILKNGVESCNESEQSPPSTPRHSESGTRPNTPESTSDPTSKTKAKTRIPRAKIPPLKMKTRGAKLPNFALQIKEGHWDRKDVDTIYNNTCVVPRKQYSDDSESDNNSNSCNSTDTKNNGEMEKISDVSDSEEPELKKLRVTPLNESPPLDVRGFQHSDSSVSLQSLNNSDVNMGIPLNPADWSINDVYKYLTSFDDCKEVAKKIKDEEIDGPAFIMLNLPTMRMNLKMKSAPAYSLCNRVITAKMQYFSQNMNVE